MYTDSHVERAMLPKLLGFSERAWAKEPAWESEENFDALEQDWNQFANRIAQYEFAKLEKVGEGFEYRVPLPGAKVVDGILEANVEFPGLMVRYTTDGTEPNGESPLYRGSTRVSGTVTLKAFTPTGQSSRSVVVEVPK